MESFKERLLEMLVERGFKYSKDPIFKLSSGKQSNYYINCKPVTMDPEGLYIIGNILYDIVKDWNISSAGGMALGAAPLALALSYTSYEKGKPIKTFIVRKQKKDYGMESEIEGPVNPGERVVILEDVITTGSSTLRAIEAAKKMNLSVEGIIVLVDRQEGGKEAIQELNVRFISLVTKDELFKKAGIFDKIK